MMILFSILQGWYIVTYALGIYLLNLFIGFLTPKIDPTLNMDSDSKIHHITLCLHAYVNNCDFYSRENL